MKLRDAAKLHNGDEVIRNQTKKVCTVYDVEVKDGLVVLHVQDPDEGFITLTHLDVS